MMTPFIERRETSFSNITKRTLPALRSLVGSLNKIPVAVVGLIAFDVPWNFQNLASIMVGLVAGIIFVKAKAAGK